MTDLEVSSGTGIVASAEAASPLQGVPVDDNVATQAARKPPGLPGLGRPPRYWAEERLLAVLRPKSNEIEVILRGFWSIAAIFCFVEAVSFIALHKSFFEALTAGEFELEHKFETVVEVHVWASVLMWGMAAVQVLWERSRHSPELLWIHRGLGKAMLVLFYVVVLPTAFYLSVRQRIDFLGPAVGAVLLDTACCTSYFLYRGWRVARTRRNGAKSLVLHGRLMRCGIVMSMSILPQRMLQFLLTAELKKFHQFNYSFSILVTSILFVIFGHFLDGPRGGIWIACIGQENAEEAYGSAVASPVEGWIWRLRWLLYMVAYHYAHRWANQELAPSSQ